MKLTITFVFTLFYCTLFSQQVSTYISGPANIDDCLFISSDGSMYASRFTGGTVSKIVDGVVSVFSDTLSNANGIAEDSEGNLYVADHYANEVFKFDIDGNGVLFCDDIIKPSGLVKIPGSDTLIITSYGQHKVYKVGPDGNAILYLDNDILDGPVSVNYNSEEILFIANYNDGKILKYDHLNDSLHIITDLNISSLGFMCFANGFLYATSAGFSAGEDPMIIKVDPNSGDTIHFANNGYGYVDGDITVAQFQRPNGIVASPDGTKLYVSEYSAQRIRMIEGIVSGIENISFENQSISLYPNPSQDHLSIKVDGLSNESISYRIINSLGSTIETNKKALDNGRIRIEHSLLPGIYFVEIRIAKQSITKKLIVQ